MSDTSGGPQPKRTMDVLGREMAWVEVGQGDPVLFLHGNPTSSYLWRNIIPHVSDRVRCIAPDLIGMGDSEKLDEAGPGSYRFVDHRRYLDAFLEQLLDDDERVVFVIHDWGSALGFDWSRRHPDRVRGIAYMEAMVKPLSWSDWPEGARPIFEALRGPAGEEMILEKNLFVETVLVTSVLRGLEPEELDEYRRPFREPGEGRRPTLSWPRELPIDGEPADVIEIVTAYAEWLAQSEIPKLFVNVEPGAILTGSQREACRLWPNQREITVPGIHFPQEDAPHEIGAALGEWLDEEVLG